MNIGSVPPLSLPAILGLAPPGLKTLDPQVKAPKGDGRGKKPKGSDGRKNDTKWFLENPKIRWCIPTGKTWNDIMFGQPKDREGLPKSPHHFAQGNKRKKPCLKYLLLGKCKKGRACFLVPGPYNGRVSGQRRDERTGQEIPGIKDGTITKLKVTPQPDRWVITPGLELHDAGLLRQGAENPKRLQHPLIPNEQEQLEIEKWKSPTRTRAQKAAHCPG